MDDFFEKGNSENWSFATFLAKTGARTNEDFSIAKTKYISEMNRMKNLEDFKNFKQKIGRYIKEAKDLKFEPEKTKSTHINIEGDVVASIIGSSSSVLKIDNNRKRQRALPKQEKCQAQEQSLKRTTDDVDIFYHVDSEQDIWDLWYQFFKECKADENMHEFSLEKVGIIQCGYKVKMRSCLINELYNHMMPKEPTSTNAFHDYEEDIAQMFSSENEVVFVSCLKQFKGKHDQDNNALFLSKTIKLLLEVPISAKKQQWIKQNEANYSEYFVWQLFKIVTKFSSNNSLCFQIGEYKLESIKHEINRRDDEKLKSCSYNADGCHTGIVGGKIVELSLLEVTGPFGCSDSPKSTKDHIKGSFGTLSLLQEIGHLFEFGSLDTFYKIRVYFVQALEENIRLWSLEQVSQGVCVMELVETANVPTKFEDCEIFIRDVTNLMWVYKNGVERSLAQVEQLEREHKEIKLSIARRLVSPAAITSLISSLEKGCVLKIKGEYIPGYQELELLTS